MGLRLDRGQSMRKLLPALLRDTRGATAVEYGLIIALIIIAMVGALTSFARSANNMWNNVSTTVSST